MRDALRDPCARAAVLTDVEVSRDLSVAKVFVQAAQPWSGDETCRHLTRASGFLHKKLAQRLRLRVTPKLVFKSDVSFEHGERIEHLLAKQSGGRGD